MIDRMTTKIAIIGLGYVGLPLAVEFGKFFETIGFDTSQKRIKELLSGNDFTLEVDTKELQNSTQLTFTSKISDIEKCNIYIITVPTPIDSNKNPDLIPLEQASKTVGGVLKNNDTVIYESTVFPGATEEICVPILEKASGLKFNIDFYCGYSPERINPGDKDHRLTSIKKITSGSTKETANKVNELYKQIVSAGTFKTESIKIAEAAKVIENTQRDVNIALVNELALIFNKMNIDTESVLEAAGTKWNFLPFKPGLVGGHCIGVDPYYLTHKAIEMDYQPEMILAGRRINDNMGFHVVNQVSKLMNKKNIQIRDSKILIMGLTFKENCPDLRNTKVIDLVNGFNKLSCNVDVYDPWVKSIEADKIYNISTIKFPVIGKYDAIILAVAHREFISMGFNEIKSFGKSNYVLFDIKFILKANQVDGRL
jgi:UDP-N-acetyl-D-glucosamine/UDP-N-acetyl-D-galactosamine dehydrogenase